VRLEHKAAIDRWLGTPLVMAANALAIPLGKWMRRDHGFANVRTIVVCKLMGMGSIVQATPLLASLRERYPGAQLVMLTRRENAPLCERLRALDRVLFVDDAHPGVLAASLLRALAAMWRARVDLFVNLEVYSNLGALLTVASCARNRLGFYLRPRDVKARGIYTQMVYFNRNAPVSEVYLQIARSAGITEVRHRLLPIAVRDADRDGLARRLEQLGLALPRARYVVVNPNASDLRLERRWPAEKYVQLIARLLEAAPELPIVLIGSPAERAYVETIRERLPETPGGRAFDLAGELSLGELFALLEGARLVITSDSGPMHAALALSVPTVSLFGPQDPAHYGIATGDGLHRILYKRIYCSPCVHHFLRAPCDGDNQCMKLIEVDEVMQEVRAALQGERSTGEDGGAERFQYRSPQTVFGVRRRES
jgi:ADP-heptose:LPS heptosyltransferase